MSAPEPALVVRTPVVGQVLPLSDVPDLVFAEAMAGPGLAIQPDAGRSAAVTPVPGRLVALQPHMFVVRTGSGRSVLVHLGIDTVELHGEGFELLAAEGDELDVGSPVVAWDPAAVRQGGRSAVCPVIAMDAPADAVDVGPVGGRAEPGAELFRWS